MASNEGSAQRARHGRCVALATAALALALPTPASAGVVEIFVTTTEDELNEDGDCSLREAIAAANTDLPVDACTAGDPTFDFIYPPVGATIALSQGPLVVNRGLGIYADGLTLTVADEVNPQPLIVLDMDGEDFELYGIWNGGHARSVLEDGRNAGDAGGAIHIAGARNVHLRDLVLRDNHAGHGGAVGVGDLPALIALSLDLLRCRFEDNHAVGDGGAVALRADSDGGLRQAALSASQSWFVGNSAGNDGGAVAWIAANQPEVSFGLQLQRLVLANNSAGGLGGGLYLPSGPGAITHALQIIDNHALDAGGAWIGLPKIDLVTSAIVRNSAADAQAVGNLVLTTPEPQIQLTAVTDAVLGADCEISGVPLQPMPNLGGSVACGFALTGSGGYGPRLVQAEGIDAFAVPATDSPVVDVFEASACPSIFHRDLFGRQRPIDGDGDGAAACDIGPVEVVNERVFSSGFEAVD
jgi:CSLREA domain-containing protein